MRNLKFLILLAYFASAIWEVTAIKAETDPIKAENTRFGYIVSDTSPARGALGNWCGCNSPASELIVFDTTENSIGLDLGTITAVSSVTVVGWDTMLAFDGKGDSNSRWNPRLDRKNVQLYYSNDNVAYNLCSSYTIRSDTDERMPHLPFLRFHFENLNIKARYIKVHCILEDDKWSWVNYQDRAITVAGHEITGRWFPQRSEPKHRDYPWAADCLPFGSNCERGLNKSEDDASWFGLTAYHPTLCEQLNARHYHGRILWRKVGFISQKYLETASGGYDFEVFDKVISSFKKYHIKILGSFNEPTTRSDPAPDPEYWIRVKNDWKSYQDFVTTVVHRYKGSISFWEGWNELEIPACRRVTDNRTGDYPKMSEFVALQKTIYDGVKAADPNAMVLNGGFCGWGLYFVERILSLGVGQYMDICGFHPYSNDPNCALEKVLAIRDMLDYYGYIDMPIWLTEIGWSSGPWPNVNSGLRVADEQTKADYLVQALDLLLPHIQVFMWYASCERWRNEKERMFGLFAPFPDSESPYLKENMAYTAYAGYTKKWYKEHNILLPPIPIDEK